MREVGQATTAKDAMREAAVSGDIVPETPGSCFECFMLTGRIRNFAFAGLRVQVDRSLSAEQPFTLSLRGVGRMHGSVLWRRADCIGVRFEDDQPDHVVELMRPTS